MTLSVLFSGDGLEGRFATAATQALAELGASPPLVLDLHSETLSIDEISALISQHRAERERLICLGFGLAAQMGLSVAQTINADAMLAIAPDISLSAITLAETTSETLSWEIRLSDFTPEDVASSNQGAICQFSPGTLLFALEHSGWIGQALATLIHGTKPPSPRELASLLHQRFAYRIELDMDRLYHDAGGRLQLSGRLHHQGDHLLPSVLGEGNPVRVGARVFDLDGRPVPQLEGRGSFPRATLEPGEVVSFQISLPRFDPGAGDGSIGIGLVCDGQFWFSDIGFSELRLAARIEESVRSRSSAEPEATSNAAISTVKLLYRTLLGREPDKMGLEHYVGSLLSEGMDRQTLGNQLIRSHEFQSAPPPPHTLQDCEIIHAHGCDFLRLSHLPLPAELDLQQADGSWTLPHFVSLCRRGFTVLDIEAGMGAYSLPAARKIGESGTVYAVEADPLSCSLLAHAAYLNELYNVKIAPILISDTFGHTHLCTNPPLNEGKQFNEQRSGLINAERLAIILTSPLDYILSNLLHIDIIRIPIHIIRYITHNLAYKISLHRCIIYINQIDTNKFLTEPEFGPISLFSAIGYSLEIIQHDGKRKTSTFEDIAILMHMASHDGKGFDMCLHPPDSIEQNPC